MRRVRFQSIVSFIVIAAATSACAGVGAVAASSLIGAAATSTASAAIGGDFKFDSVTWARTPTDTNTITVKGVLTWNKARTGNNNTPYWDISGQTGGVSAIGVELVDTSGRMVMRIGGVISVWQKDERITMVPTGIPVRFELKTTPISPNVLRTVKTVTMRGVVARNM